MELEECVPQNRSTGDMTFNPQIKQRAHLTLSRVLGIQLTHVNLIWSLTG